jgi:hypothetical protein
MEMPWPIIIIVPSLFADFLPAVYTNLCREESVAKQAKPVLLKLGAAARHEGREQ